MRAVVASTSAIGITRSFLSVEGTASACAALRWRSWWWLGVVEVGCGGLPFGLVGGPLLEVFAPEGSFSDAVDGREFALGLQLGESPRRHVDVSGRFIRTHQERRVRVVSCVTHWDASLFSNS